MIADSSVVIAVVYPSAGWMSTSGTRHVCDRLRNRNRASVRRAAPVMLFRPVEKSDQRPRIIAIESDLGAMSTSRQLLSVQHEDVTPRRVWKSLQEDLSPLRAGGWEAI
jgi:hypothetical protein